MKIQFKKWIWILFIPALSCSKIDLVFQESSGERDTSRPPEVPPAIPSVEVRAYTQLKSRHTVSEQLKMIYGPNSGVTNDIQTLITQRISFFGGPCELFKAANYADCIESSIAGQPNEQFSFNTQAAIATPRSTPGRQSYLLRACHALHARDEAIDHAVQLASGKPNVSPSWMQFQSTMNRCTSCHVPQGSPWVNFKTEREWISSGLVVPGNPTASVLYQRITSSQAGFRMPPSSPVPAPEIANVSQWISQLDEIPDRPVSEDVAQAFMFYYSGTEPNAEVIQRLEAVRASVTQDPAKPVSEGWRALYLTLCVSLLHQAQ